GIGVANAIHAEILDVGVLESVEKACAGYRDRSDALDSVDQIGSQNAAVLDAVSRIGAWRLSQRLLERLDQQLDGGISDRVGATLKASFVRFDQFGFHQLRILHPQSEVVILV